MGFIAEYTIQNRSGLAETHRRAPEMVLEMEDLQVHGEDVARYVFWASGGDFERFEEGLEADETVAKFAQLATVGDRRLYRITFSEQAREKMTYDGAGELDIVFLEATSTNEGVTYRTQVPSREALHTYRDACIEEDADFHLDRIYQDGDSDGGSEYGLTERQHEALTLALERGYYGSTRDASLEELADELGISRQALADRLRRGLENLLTNTIG